MSRLTRRAGGSGAGDELPLWHEVVLQIVRQLVLCPRAFRGSKSACGVAKIR
jgi:hypothetical protein